MNSTQRVVKYIAMFLAGCLTIAITAAIVNVGVGVLGAFVPDKKNTIKTEKMGNNNTDITTNTSDGEVFEYSEVDVLDISSSVYKVEIKLDKEVDGVRIVKNNIPSSFHVTYDKNNRVLKTEDDNWISGLFGKKRSNERGSVHIYVSDEQKFKKIKVEMGIGAVKLKDLVTETLDVQCGVGTFSCKNVKADTAEIDGGVGMVSCQNVSFGGMELSGGVGDIEVDGKITGKIEVSVGMGNLDLNIDGNKKDYSIIVENNLGPIYIDGQKTKDLKEKDNGQNNVLDVEGGIGAVHLDFK